jgi:hypothetical protein
VNACSKSVSGAIAAAALCLGVLASCGPRGTVPTLVLLDGYRNAADPCRTVARTAYTRRWQDAGGILVACPSEMPRLERFAPETDALAVDRVGAYVLYRVGGPSLPPV